MKKGAKIALVTILILVVPSVGLLGYKIIHDLLSDDENGWFNPPFDNEGRYDDSVLNNMTVIYESQSDIVAWNEGFSASDVCPWGFKHEGLDYFFVNDSVVLAAAPGKVVDIEYRDNGLTYDNRYWVTVHIQFNETVEFSYNFESWTNKTSDWENQQSMISVMTGEWVEQGQEIGRFLAVGGGAHIHFDVIEDNQKFCPQKYLSTTSYNELLSLVHSYHPTWDLCYP
ncbi:MAG: M23 family metallopeptidase [Promethearchaeota archaeon]|nr:MAG: M23 family metallopeptidase [Candidatus Lokiarchaeota archaeon]